MSLNEKASEKNTITPAGLLEPAVLFTTSDFFYIDI